MYFSSVGWSGPLVGVSDDLLSRSASALETGRNLRCLVIRRRMPQSRVAPPVRFSKPLEVPPPSASFALFIQGAQFIESRGERFATALDQIE